MIFPTSNRFAYWVLPLVVGAVLVFMNYSGVYVLTQLVSPDINREFGLLEHLQLLLIAISLVYAVKAIPKKEFWLEKLGYIMMALFFVFLFLEELDYGLHYIEYFSNKPPTESAEIRNFHNQGDNNYYLRQASYVIMVLLFVVLPLIGGKIKNTFTKYFCANRYLVSTFAVYLFVGQLSRWLPRLGMPNNQSLWGNHQEFEELILYYIILLYVYEIAIQKKPLFNAKGRLTEKHL